MKICPTCGRECGDTANYCSVCGTKIEAETRRPIPKPPNGIEVAFPELEGLMLLEQASVILRIRQVVFDAVSRVAEGIYDSDLLFSRIWLEIQKSRNLVRGFVGKESRKDLCEFFEENFTEDHLRPIFEKAEKDFLLSPDLPENKYLLLRSYIEVKTEGAFQELIRKLRKIERR